MFLNHIEKLKTEFTDQYVEVDASLPELKRFSGHTGFVKTVNMSGRALVEFMNLENNIGWYDIDVDFLKIVDEPTPEEESKAKAATEKPAAKKPAAKPAAGGAMSVADILAAARGGGDAAATPAAKAPAAKPKMSVEEMMAAARAEKSAAPEPAAAATPEPAAPEAPAPAAESAPTGDLPTSPADIVAWCQQRDGS
jgi:pyruvate/2-oxoglutarate dehydrogenase complex dihydrolipoamide acyltransferase (E2) component